MKFGLHYQISLSEGQTSVQRYSDTIEQAVASEALGFESVWPVEQHFWSPLSILPAPLILLGGIAARTKTLKLGTAVVLMTLAHPLRVAVEAAMIDVMSNGRLELGVGRGSLALHFKGFGLTPEDNRARMLEGIEMIRGAWSNERLSFSGRFYNATDLEVTPKPVQAMPVIRVATNSEDSFVEHGRLGFPIFVGTHVNNFQRLRQLLPTYFEARRAAGHPDLGGDEVTMLVPFFVGESREQVKRDIEHSVKNNFIAAASLPAENEWLKQVLERFRHTTYEQADEASCIFGPPDYCIERLLKLRSEFGAGRVICWFNFGGQVPHKTVLGSMELFSTKVLPYVRDHQPVPLVRQTQPA